MVKVTENRVRVEQWNVSDGRKPRFADGRVVVTKIAVRNSRGQFHGATNFKGSVIGK